MIVSLIQDEFEVLQSTSKALHHLSAFSRRVRARVDGRMETGADLLDARLEVLPLEEGDEDRLENQIPCGWVLDGLLQFSLPEEHVAPGDTP